MNEYFRSIFGNGQSPQRDGQPAKPAEQHEPHLRANGPYKEGDVIGGTYEILQLLGKGGFGLVYLAKNHAAKHSTTSLFCALKTFRDEFEADANARDAFKREAQLWVQLERHPFILEAQWVEELSRRLFVVMDYVAPDKEGRVNLGDHLKRGQPIAPERMVEWAIQFCLGMEHANAHGIKCHRDIKPANILVFENVVKIADFGLAAVEVAWKGPLGPDISLVARDREDSLQISIMRTEGGMRCGTPGYMAPEVYRRERADVRSDIYSFGLVLWQMATGSVHPPFIVTYRGDMEAFLREIYHRQMAGRVPPASSLLDVVIDRCLDPVPSKRYSNFGELRGKLEPIFQNLTGRAFAMPTIDKQTASFWNNKGGSLHHLGRYEEAISCLDKALAIDPHYALAWRNKGCSLVEIGQREDAVICYDMALKIDPQFSAAWSDKGAALGELRRFEAALVCFDKALALDPDLARTWRQKGETLNCLGRHVEAIACHNKALTIDPQYAFAWNGKGAALYSMNRFKEAVDCCDKALSVDSQNCSFWRNKGNALFGLGQYEKAIECFKTALAINPHDALAANKMRIVASKIADLNKTKNDQATSNQNIPKESKAMDNQEAILAKLSAEDLYNGGTAFAAKGEHEAAISCFVKALDKNPEFVEAWNAMGESLIVLGDEDALEPIEAALAVNPQFAKAWYNKALCEENAGNAEAAISSYNKFIELASPRYGGLISSAKKRIHELEGR